MKKFLTYLSISFLPLFFYGCSSIQVSQDYAPGIQFSGLKTYQWLPADQQTKPTATEFTKNNPLIAKRIEDAIRYELSQKGLSIVDQKADAYITYHISSIQKLRSSPVTTTIGFGTGFGSHTYGGFGFQTGADIDQYEQGQLIIDVLSKQGKLLWRGKSTTPLEEHTTPEETTKLINEVIQKLLAQYPPDQVKKKDTE
ncbi:MAG: DUF4136 domain-containing protein [Hydrogenovibrio sp.]|nr:DUF4136 domain-containing protein [Hydrogenovibrio sp.]